MLGVHTDKQRLMSFPTRAGLLDELKRPRLAQGMFDVFLLQWWGKLYRLASSGFGVQLENYVSAGAVPAEAAATALVEVFCADWPEGYDPDQWLPYLINLMVRGGPGDAELLYRLVQEQFRVQH